MALVLRPPVKIGPQGPTELLKEALKDFENALSLDQKRLYQQACSKPEATSVATFVTQIDGDNRGRARRCFAPRLFTFLNATRQFSDAVDTFVSSNPHIAGLIWGGVKTAILTASNVASYFEKVTDLLMRIGRFCPVYDDFGSLYPGAIGLQAALCKFYVTIIRLCTKIILGSQRSVWQQIVSPIANPFEVEFKSFASQLEQDGHEVELQLVLASRQADRETAKLLELDRQQSASNWKSALQYQRDGRTERAQAAIWREQQKTREDVKTRASVRDNLSPVDYEKPWKQILRQRVSNTAEWFAADPQFLEWKEEQRTAVLWCSGNLGTGKSVLVSNIIAHLLRDSTPSKIVTHFFCRFDQATSVDARNVLGSICQQLLRTEIESAKGDTLEHLHADTCDLDLAGVVALISSRLDPERVCYLLLDGLDECEDIERGHIAKALARLVKAQERGLKILCAARPDTTDGMSSLLAPDYRMTLASEEVHTDIARYIQAALEERLDDGRLKLGDSTLILAISEALQKGSHGMFLWTRLMVDEICAQAYDNAIRTALKHLPRELSEIFTRKLARIACAARPHLSIKLLQFCGVTKRPLNISEFQEALGLELGQESLDVGNRPNDIGGIVAACDGLVYADEEDYTVHYVHHSVRQHLYDLPGPHSDRFDWPNIDKHFGLLCMTYLNFNDFRGQVEKKRKSVLVDPIQIGYSALRTKSDLTNRLAKQILSKSKKTSSLNSDDFRTNLQKIMGANEASSLPTHFPLLGYAKQHWIYHLQCLKASDGEAEWRLFRKCVDGEVREADRPWQTYSDHGISDKLAGLSEGVGPLTLWAASHNHRALLSGDFHRPMQDLKEFWRLMESATEEHQKELMEIIVMNPLTFDKGKLASVLMMAVDHCAVKMTEVCLRAGANPNTRMVYDASKSQVRSGTPLQVAAANGSVDIVMLLLDRGAHLELVHYPSIEEAYKAEARALREPGLTSYWNWTPLQVASDRGHVDVVKRLLEAGADVDAGPATMGTRTALQVASDRGHVDVVKRLLEAGADVDAGPATMGTRTALQVASDRGHVDVVKRLLEAGGDVNAGPATSGARTALQAACEQGHTDVVRALLEAGADIKANPARYRGINAPRAAQANGHIAIQEMLCDGLSDSEGDFPPMLQAKAVPRELESLGSLESLP